jgi:hypothetical protein
MNTLSFAEKRKLLSIAKRMIVAEQKKKEAGQKYNNLLKSSEITLSEFANPTTAATRNIRRRLEQYENTHGYHQQHLANLANQIIRNYPNSISNMGPGTIARKAQNNINKYLRAARSVANQWTFFTGLRRAQRRNRAA